MGSISFSDARRDLAELMRKVTGSSRVYKITNQRLGSEAALVDWDYLQALHKEAAILSDPDRLASILKSREASRRGELKDYPFGKESQAMSKKPGGARKRPAKAGSPRNAGKKRVR